MKKFSWKSTSVQYAGVPIIRLTLINDALQVHVVDQVKGTAELRLKAPLNCEEKKSYQFDIQALSCTGAFSER